MKLTFLFLFVCSLHVSAIGYAQRVFTLNMKNVGVDEVLSQLQKESDYRFFYNNRQVKALDKVSIVVENETLANILDRILNKKLSYQILEENIVIISPPKASGSADQPIQGTVTDEKGMPLTGVSVQIKGTKKGVTTDAKGSFAIDADPGAVLVISFVGYEAQEIAVNKQTNLQVKLQSSSSELEQLVVIGYGTVRKRDVTGSVGQVKVNELQKAPVISFEEALAGRMAGVKVTSADGQPGAPINVVIRGTNSVTQDNSPLYVIDGFPMENPDNYTLNPAEIESIEVLKDASSTAIYGARGANGVVIITTKKGKMGDPVVAYNSYYGFMQNKRKMDLMNAYEFVKYQYERDSANANAIYLTDGKKIEDFRNAPSIDLQDEIFRSSPFQNHFLSVSGGKGGTRYAVSGSILNQDGVIKNSGYDRYQGRVNLDQTVNSNLKIGINSNYSVTNRFGTVPSEQVTGFFYGNLLYSVWGYRPATGRPINDPVDNQDDDFLSLQGFNPVQTVENEHRKNRTDLLTVNAYAEYAIGKYLKLRVSGGLTKSKITRESFNNSKTRLGSPLTTSGQNNGINGSVISNELQSLLNENTLSFNKTFNKDHNLNAVAGFTAQKTTTSSYGAAANHIPNEALGIAGIDEGQPVNVNSTASLYTLASFLARVNYSYKSKYLLTASIRSDGSSKFSEDNKWGYFPSAALAWRLDRENFMRSFDFISDAKLRVSYGVTGNNRVPDFAYLSQIDLPSSLGYSYNNLPVNAAIISELGNMNLKWESTNQFNVGIDLGFLNDRFTLVADWYRKVTSDLLLNAKLPSSMGFTDAVKNIGKVQNQGLEFTLNSVNVKNKNFTWNSNFNISFNRNKVLALAENQSTLFTLATWNIDLRTVPLYIAEVGQPVARFWGYQWEGNYQFSDFDETAPSVYVLKSKIATYNKDRTLTKPGDIKYKDINGDGVVNTDDRTIIGNPNPKFTGGFSNDITWKNFDLNVFIEFSYGNDVMNGNRIIFEGGGRVNQNMYATYLDRWTPENQNNEFYRTNGRGPADFGYSTRVVEDASYARIKTVSLGYNIPARIISKAMLKAVRVYASAQNLHTFTKYKGFDPEVSAYGNSALMPGFDYSVYPRSRTIIFGANISF
ncbi:SusC/RagA family TonB-linked outer membrane protein [Pseudobacter ginsenosidimutans]|uniref:TonB-linked SusC/RagA family outer membrane protein n=1 Tax=Pseudobacter ginsenosidimutans TaxID=661488 RepID=A0A4Q7N3F4_9BACT|nr:SusC/RagA family TonB-linked outer membrane protein [Pseudobacter ginsenosidimutans]QEC43639.1 SusC/RagA family TonB-linked outer membrane protein [Pseudobacter ginsenosidimutans]RZS75038.1 TonB-linked SusC/RagA family outer membrane protein [Pseudobacter ginsenosidimutans]